MECVLYPIVMATATGEMGLMATGGDVHTATAMAMEKIEFFSPFRCRCRRIVNEPSHIPQLLRKEPMQ